MFKFIAPETWHGAPMRFEDIRTKLATNQYAPSAAKDITWLLWALDTVIDRLINQESPPTTGTAIR